MAIVFSMSLAVPGPAEPAEREGVHNGTFELGLSRDWSRPDHWYVGFPGDDPPPPGTWSIVRSGDRSGHDLELRSADEDGFFVSQVVDLPARAMAGTTLTIRSKVREVTDDGWAVVQLIAVNPEAPADPETGIHEVGHVVLGSQQQDWTQLSDTVTLTDVAELLVVMLVASGEGAIARFDDVSVTASLEEHDDGPAPAELPLPAGGAPRFLIGVTNESTRNPSDAAHRDLPLEAARIAELVNLFVHVRWNALAGKPPLDGHDRILEQGELLRRHGMHRMVTLDFTHDSLEGLGDLNPMPDGSPVGRLDEVEVREAYLAELEALVESVRPSIVSVGIETDFFWKQHPDQWPAFRDLLCQARSRIETIDPAIHVTTYFTLGTLVAPDTSLMPQGTAAMRELLPCIESVGYSYYPADGARRLADIPDGMFTAALAVAPDLELIIPEFGYRSDGIYSEEDQEAFLRRAVDELAGVDVVAMVWYSLYDQTYLGVDPWFQEAFRSIGLRRLDGTPKRSHALLEHIRVDGRRRNGGRRVGVPSRIEGW